MFETTLTLGKETSRARRAASLTLAFGAQAALVCAFTLASLYSRDVLEPPPLMMTGLPEVPVHLTLMGRKPADKPAAKPPETPKTPQPDKGLQAPAQVPDRITTAPDHPSAPDEPGVPDLPLGWIPVDGSPNSPLSLTPEAPKRVVLNPYDVVQVPKLLSHADPVYPPAAAAMGLVGRVDLQVVIDELGRVEDVQVLRATNPIFVQAAVDAVRRWRYSRPVSKNGQTVACYLAVSVSFTLS